MNDLFGKMRLYGGILGPIRVCYSSLPQTKKHIRLKNQMFSALFAQPIGSMYGIYTFIYHKNQPNVHKYTIHGFFGKQKHLDPGEQDVSSLWHLHGVRTPRDFSGDKGCSDVRGLICRFVICSIEKETSPLKTRWWFQYIFYFHPENCGNDPI